MSSLKDKLDKAVELREQYFPNAHFCALESLQRFIDLIYGEGGTDPSRADHWMFVAHYVEESTYNRQLRRYEKEECRSEMEWNN